MSKLIAKIAREPLFQFLLIACLLLVFERLVTDSSYADNQYKIYIDDQLLVQYLQLRAKTFNLSEANSAFQGLSAEARQQLIDDYVREEVLFREAQALNLDRDDPLIRRRLIQKMEYVAQGFYDDIQPLSEDDLRAFYKQNSERYRKAPEITFTHVFIAVKDIAAKDSEVEQAEKAAIQLLDQLNTHNVPFENAPRYGQRFLFNRNYINREAREISSHFGDSFQRQLFALQAAERWQGPIVSNYGWHLVLIKKISSSYLPSFEEISATLLADAQRLQHQALLRKAVDQLIDQYQVTVEPIQ
jgi:hypothetical protein